ncbi:MAG: hypothetical protein ACI9GM_000575 [Salibacteraceae bacterium]|jgi:hypothetical protein
MNNTIRKLIFVLSISWLCNVANSQSISGFVVDHMDDSRLAFVSVIIEGTTMGSVSDIDGYFTLTPTEYPVNLRFHTLGYLDTTITFNKAQKLRVALVEKVLELREAVIIAGENPAIRIVKKAIENRDLNNPEKNYAFTYETYSKMVFGPDVSHFNEGIVLTDSSSSSDSSMYRFNTAMNQHYLFITETVSERKFLPPNHSFEKVIANRFSGLSNPTFTMIATEFQPFSYYSDYVEVIGLKYLSPLAKNSFKDYVFELKEILYENGDSIYVIYFQPKKGTTFYGLRGTMSINSNQYAIQNIRVKQASPVSSMQIEMEQMSEFVNGKYWFPVQFNTHIEMKLDQSANSDLGISFINARGKTYVKNIHLDAELNKKDFPNVQLELEESANTKSEEFWKSARKEELNSKETNTYVVIDSIGVAEKLDKKLKLIEDIATGLIPIGPVSIELGKIADFNQVEGIRLGLGVRTNDKISKYFSVGGYGAYGFSDKEFKYGGDLKLNLLPKNDVFAGIQYRNDVTPTALVEWHKPPEFNLRSYSDLFISKMDHIEGFEAYVTFRAIRDFQNKVFFNNYSQSYSHSYTYVPNGDTVLTPNKSFNRAEIGWAFRFGLREKYIRSFNKNISMGTKYPYVWVRLAAADEVLGSSFNYQKIDVKVSKNYLIKGVGEIGFQFSGGTTMGDVPLSLLHFGSGMRVNGINLYIENGFNTMAPNEFVSQSYASGFFHYNIGAMYKKPYSAPEISFVTAAGWGTLDTPEFHQDFTYETMEKGFFESGILLDNVLVMNTSGIGLGVFYRYGAYALPEVKDNFGFSFTIKYVFQ